MAASGMNGCSKPAFDGQTYRASDVAFRIGPLPATWQRLDVDGERLAYRDPTSDTIVSVGARCGRDADDVPLSALTQHLFIQFTERSIVDQQRIDLDGREALRTVMNAKLDGVPRRFRVVVLKKDGCVYDFSEIATSKATAQSDAVFESVVAGFHTTSTGSRQR
ncbi:MAG TPA: hypothetical protein VIV60_27170 [Polyangiaceae bacterium]